jgi:hypothetical protein
LLKVVEFVIYAERDASYRTEIEEMIGLGDRVMAVLCDYARREPDAPEVALKAATAWPVRDGRVVRAEFYARGRAEAVYRLRDGMIIRLDYYNSRRQAVEAAGLAE